jgi:hypothetical protein
MKTLFKIIILSSFLFLIGADLYAGKRIPIAVLFQTKGQVEYTKDGVHWKDINRNKPLFVGYQVRTADTASGKISIQTTHENFILNQNSLVLITAKGIEIKNGSLSKIEQPGRLISGLRKRFNRSRSYTTVR